MPLKPYFEDSKAGIVIYHGDCREIVPALDRGFDCAIADPPYGQTALEWDRWPTDWPDAVESCASVWCFGSLKMFMGRASQFSRFTLAQDVVWEKHNGSNFHADRFRRVHEQAAHFYHHSIPWERIYKNPVYINAATAKKVRYRSQPTHTGEIGTAVNYETFDGGPKLQRSVIYERSCNGYAENETQKPLGIVSTLIEYSCPPDGVILSPFCGSGTDGVAAKRLGREAVLIDIREDQCELAARRLSQELPFKRGETA